ncbi:MAG TPA: hypothetical protein DDZ65_09175, partial [Firmicutes bacterium]|nr:hypothetical protein [Bacillota bacterium]
KADTDGDIGNQSITVPADVMDFSNDKYAAMGLDSQTTVDKEDFIAFYNGASLNESSTKAGYGRITNVTKDGTNYVITYTDAAEDDVLAAMDLYNTRNEKIELTEAEKAAIEADMETKALESGFVEEAATYLTALALETDGFRELSDDLDMDLKSYSVTFADGTPLEDGDMALMGSKVEVTKKEISATIGAGKVLQHFNDSYGIRAELAMTFTLEVDGKIEITLQAIFEQEVMLSINTSGGAEWRWAWIIPYIYDYKLNANIDLGTYTGIGITATAKSIGTEDDDEYDWKPVSGKAGEAKLIDIGKQITELMEQKEEFLGEKMVDENGEEIEWAGTNGGGLTEKYANFMENAEESWIEIFRAEIFAQEGFVDLFHILCYGVSADFVVKANLYVTMGMSFEYGVAKRYNFSLKLFHKVSSNETIDLEEAHYNFDFYVMGTAGIRAGIELEVAVGLFSLKMDSIGICAEVGAYAQMWGYFYYHLGWTKSGGKESSYSGAMAIEIGMYLTISFKAQLFSSKKLTYQPTLYDKKWPLLTIGEVENVYDFAYGNGVPSLRMKIMSAKEFSISPDLFGMNYMDLKSGEIFGSDAEDKDENPPKIYDDASESHFSIAMSNPKFHYHPNTNTITVDGDVDLQEKCEMTITWKRGALAFTSKPIVRTLFIEWSDPVNARYINFDTDGGSVVGMISDNSGRKITRPGDPTKVGYSFGGWYTNSGLTNAFDFPTTLPDYPNKGITVYAKWIPRNDTKYTVEHYLQELNGTYTLKETEGKTGTTKTQTNAAAKTGGDYASYQAKPFVQTVIEPDGSAVMKVYYQRKTYTVKFTYGTMEDGSDNTAPLTYTAKYGSVVYAPTMALGGYDFDEYQGLSPDNNGGVTVTGAASYSAQWTARDDTPYRIEHYIQRTDGAGYILPGDNAIISDYGTTGSLININAKKLTDAGLTYVEATVNGSTVTAPTIGADGKTVVKLYYDRNSYNLNFMDGSTTYKTEQTRFDKTLQAPTAPTKDGYTFAGWFKDSACSVGNEFDFTDAAMPANDLTLYAKWNAGERTYTVNYYLMGTNGQYAIESVDSNQSAKTGDVLTLSDLAKTAYGDGITYDHATVGDSTITTYTIPASGTVTVNLYYSRAQYDLTWDLAGGYATNIYTNTGKVYCGASITAPVLTKAGYTYVWDVTPASAMPAANLAYTAVWTANTDTPYKVEHYQQNADGTYPATPTETEDLSGITDATATADAKTADENYAYFTENTTHADHVASGIVTADGKLVLKLYYARNSYTLTFKNGAKTVSSGSVLYGAPITAPTLAKIGYTLSWNPAVPRTMPAANSTYEAVWTANDDTAYKVEHYQQNANDNGYTLFETENLSGATAAAVTAAAKTTGDYEHFTENTTHASRV